MKTTTYLTQHIPNFHHKWKTYKGGLKEFKIKDWCVSSDYVDDKNKPNCLITFSIFPKCLINKITKDMLEFVPTDIKNITNISSKTLNFLRETPYFFTISIVLENKKKLCNDMLKNRISKLIDIYKKVEQNKEIFRDKYLRLQKFNQYLNKNHCSKEKVGLMLYVAKFVSYIMEFLLIKENGNSPVWISDRDSITELADGIIYDFILEYTEEHVHNRISNYNLNAPIIPEGERKNADTVIRYPDIISGVLSSLHPKGINLAYEKEKHKLLFQEIIMSNPRLIILKSKIYSDNTEDVQLIEYFKKEDVPAF